MAIQSDRCPVCEGCGWICENHGDKPWDGASDSARACHCGGAGAPCVNCNPCDEKTPPKLPPGFKTTVGPDGWVN